MHFTKVSFRSALLALLTLYTLAILPATAQQLTGKVVDRDNPTTPLIGANVVWQGSNTGTATDASGRFIIAKTEAASPYIIVSYIGYQPDTILVEGKSDVLVKLASTGKLQEVVVEGQQARYSSLTPTNSQVVTSRDLEKSACCNLAESFETNASVEVSTTDAVSGAKQIQMLGLDGSYTLLTTDNIPALRGLATPYRLNYLSGTCIESIDIIKGTGSVLNGYESISGQVNVALKDPEEAERLYFNLYGNSLAKFDANLNLATGVGSKWNTILMLHSNHLGNRVDRNDDGFMDLSLGTQYNVFNKWKYAHKDVISEFGVNALTEKKVGGQVDFNEDLPQAQQSSYGTTSDTDRLYFYNKTSYTFPGRPYQSIGVITSATHHKFDAAYGYNQYKGEQNSASARLIFQSIIGNTGHTYKTGLSYNLDNYTETLNDSTFGRNEHVPGVFAEYIYNNASNLTVVAGARADFHNLYGTVFTPRLNVKFDATPNTIFRVAAGKGFRVANPIAENSAILVSSRGVAVKEQLEPETAWNLGGSFTQYFELGGRPGTFVTDYYYTTFTDQVVLDMYTNPKVAMFYNLDGRSFSKSFQAELQYEVLKGLDVKTAYKYFDVKTTYQGELIEKPMIPQHRFFVNLGFATPFDKWRADLTGQYFGTMPLAPVNQSATTDMLRTSDSFYTFNGQVSRAFKRWEVYVGGENLLNFKQKNPIIGADQPFGPNFDASMVWGPITGRVVYAGLRLKID